MLLWFIASLTTLVLLFFIACRLLRVEERVLYWTHQFARKLDLADIRSIKIEEKFRFWRMVYFSEEWTAHKQQVRDLTARLDELEARTRALTMEVVVSNTRSIKYYGFANV